MLAKCIAPDAIAAVRAEDHHWSQVLLLQGYQDHQASHGVAMQEASACRFDF